MVRVRVGGWLGGWLGEWLGGCVLEESRLRLSTAQLSLDGIGTELGNNNLVEQFVDHDRVEPYDQEKRQEVAKNKEENLKYAIAIIVKTFSFL